MSTEDEPPEDDIDGDTDLDLVDTEDYHRKQRLKEIHKARQRVHEKIHGFGRAAKLKEGRYQRRQLAEAASMYVTELETIMEHTDVDTSLPDRYPWDDVQAFADALGYIPKDYDHEMKYAPKQDSVLVFRTCNRVLSDLKPLIKEDENTEWEV